MSDSDSNARDNPTLAVSSHTIIQLAINNLPTLSPDNVPLDDTCPICLATFESVYSEEPHSGVTKLDGCGHLFCKRDLVEWIRNRHGSCPTCRHAFLDIKPPSESDDESSDGGEYIPDEDEDDEDLFLLDTDGFTDEGELDLDEMDLGLDLEEEEDMWADGDDEMEEWGSNDGDLESESLSEGDISFDGEQDLELEGTGRDGGALEMEVSVAIHAHADAGNDSVDSEEIPETDSK